MGKARIAIVDDDRKVLEMVSTLLGKKGYETATAASGREGIDLIKDFAPDLILMDIIMPDLNGSDVVMTLNKEPGAGLSAPVIFFSGIAEQGTDKPSVNVGGRFYPAIAKPFEPDTLLSEVAKALKN